ncbi:MAG: HAD family hydrolase [Butyricicoccus sp.]
MKQGAIFDMDGLLFDTEAVYRRVWNHLPQEFGLENDPSLGEAVCGTSGEQLCSIIRDRFPSLDPDLFIQTGLERVQTMIRCTAPEEKPGVRRMLDYLHAHGVRLAVASGSPQDLIEYNLCRAGIRRYFRAVISGFSVPNGKPAPDIFLESARRIGCAPKDCYVFEDGKNGIRAAAAAGCAPVMIPDLTPPDEEIRRLCTGIYPSLTEAMDAIQQEKL